jgi:hypothetical protein
MFIMMNSLLFFCGIILVLASIIAPAIKILKIINELDIKSVIKNWEIDIRLLGDNKIIIEIGTEIINQDIVNHQ